MAMEEGLGRREVRFGTVEERRSEAARAELDILREVEKEARGLVDSGGCGEAWGCRDAAQRVLVSDSPGHVMLYITVMRLGWSSCYLVRWKIGSCALTP
jgi:hypothetical protein